jgi:hypothetical protein
VLFNSAARKMIGGPADKNSPRSPNRGAEIKAIKSFRGKIMNKLQINDLSFSFLQTKNVSTTFLNLVSSRIPLIPVI